MILEIDADGWVKIIGAVGVLVGLTSTAIIGVIMAWKVNNKLNVAAQRREEIAISQPGNPVPPATLSPPKE